MTTTIINGITPWNEKEKNDLQKTAFRILSEHYPHTRPDYDNCSACAVGRMTFTTPPNYAGWLRVYIQARRSILRRHFEDEMDYAKKENMPYHQAILKDIATFGIDLED